MNKTRFTEQQIAFALRQAEQGIAVEEITRKMGVSEATFCRWKKRFAGMGIAELRRLRQLEAENRKLKNLVADLSLDKAMLQDVVNYKLGLDTPGLDLPANEFRIQHGNISVLLPAQKNSAGH